jgi:transcriptional regulator with XRE-family HTH domain
MSDVAQTFGQAIVAGRRKKGLTQRGLAERIKRDDGVAISGAYLNDIEHDRRSPSRELVVQFARELEIDAEYLAYLAGRFPNDQTLRGLTQDQFVGGMMAFRRGVEKK